MTAPYHKRSNAAPARVKGALGLVLVGGILALGGCSVSMPMTGLVDSSSVNAVASPASADGSKDKPVVEVAAAKPEL